MVEKGSPGWFSCVDGCGVLVVVVVVVSWWWCFPVWIRAGPLNSKTGGRGLGGAINGRRMGGQEVVSELGERVTVTSKVVVVTVVVVANLTNDATD